MPITWVKNSICVFMSRVAMARWCTPLGPIASPSWWSPFRSIGWGHVLLAPFDAGPRGRRIVRCREHAVELLAEPPVHHPAWDAVVHVGGTSRRLRAAQRPYDPARLRAVEGSDRH